MRKLSTNPLQKHRAITINNSCMHLKPLLRRYTGRVIERRENTKAGKRENEKRKIRKKENERERLSIK